MARQSPGPVKAAGSVELTDLAGDVQPIIYRESVGSGPEREVKYPAFDVVKLAGVERRQGDDLRGDADRSARPRCL